MAARPWMAVVSLAAEAFFSRLLGVGRRFCRRARGAEDRASAAARSERTARCQSCVGRGLAEGRGDPLPSSQNGLKGGARMATMTKHGSSALTRAYALAPRALVRYAWATLVFNVLVIAWGAVVRATGSGARRR